MRDYRYAQQLELQLNKTQDATPEEVAKWEQEDFFRAGNFDACLLYTSPSPRDRISSRMPSSA